jgi:hypothetical protein
MARPGAARQYVTWYGNQDNFSGIGLARQGRAGRGGSGPGMARQYVTWYGNQDNFQGRASRGVARQGPAWRG